MAASQNVSVHTECPYPFQMHVSTSTECRKRGAEQCCLCQLCVQHVQIWQLHPQTDSSMQRGHSEHWQQPQLLQWQTQHVQLERRGQRSRCTKMFQAPTCTGYISPFLFQASLPVCFHRVRLPNKPVCLCAQRWREVWHTQCRRNYWKCHSYIQMKQYGPPCISFNTVHVLAQPRTEWRVMLPL